MISTTTQHDNAQQQCHDQRKPCIMSVSCAVSGKDVVSKKNDLPMKNVITSFDQFSSNETAVLGARASKKVDDSDYSLRDSNIEEVTVSRN
jgi:hypothetical protein